MASTLIGVETPLPKLRRQHERGQLESALAIVEQTSGETSLEVAALLETIGDRDHSRFAGLQDLSCDAMLDNYTRAISIFPEKLSTDDEVLPKTAHQTGLRKPNALSDWRCQRAL